MSVSLALEIDADLADRLTRIFGHASDPMPEIERRAYEELPDTDVIVWEGDATTFHFLYVSASAERVLGYPSTRWTTEERFWSDVVVHPEDRDDAVAYCALCTGKGQDHAFIYRAVAADGRIVVLHDVVRVVLGRRRVASHLRGIMIAVPDGGALTTA